MKVLRAQREFIPARLFSFFRSDASGLPGLGASTDSFASCAFSHVS